MKVSIDPYIVRIRVCFVNRIRENMNMCIYLFESFPIDHTVPPYISYKFRFVALCGSKILVCFLSTSHHPNP